MLPNFRRNPLTGHWVIVAEGRDLRPNEFQSHLVRQSTRRCPFCGGHEDDTPGEVASFSRDGSNASEDDWVVRVVPNKYPALLADQPFMGLDQTCGQTADANGRQFGPYAGFQSGGIHELVIESRRHIVSFGELTVEESRLSLRVYRDRLARIAEQTSMPYGMVFKNCRPDAGASIEHAHSQLIGTSIVPASVAQHVARTTEYRREHGRPLGADLVRFELDSEIRVVAETANFVAFCPFASHLAFETWVYPKTFHASFLAASDEALNELADLTMQCVKRLEGVLNDPPYNLTLNIAPFDSAAEQDYQWHLEISPRLTKLAGFEWGTGCMIVPVSPEAAAERLRQFDLA